MILRDYQQAAVQAFWQYYLDGNTGNPIIAMPTGTGKSLVNAAIIETVFRSYPQTKVLCLTHVKELISNNYETLIQQWPTAPVGIYSSGLKRRDLHAPITFGGIASIYQRAALFQKTDLILIDECHLVSEKATGRYLTFINSLKVYNPALKVIGLSATPFRLGLGHLVDGKLFTSVCFDLTSGEAFIWMVEQAYLAPVIPKYSTIGIDTSEVPLAAGEFNSRKLKEAIDAQGVIQRALDEALVKAKDRKHWLVFASSIEHCDEIADYLTLRGVPTVSVHSKISNAVRDERLTGFKTGRYQAVVNQNILTTGFDFPDIDAIIMLRPTRSPGLWVQMLGRGTRPVYALGYDLSVLEGRLAALRAGPKRNCLVLDYAKNTKRLGPINYPEMPQRRNSKGGGDAPIKICPDCGTMVHARVMVCPDCGYAFPPPEHLQSEADALDLIQKRTHVQELVFQVDRMIASKHTKKDKPDSMRVDYFSGYQRFTEWVGVEHTGWFKNNARTWWAKHSLHKGKKMPSTTLSFLKQFNDIVRRPTHIRVKMTHPFTRIIDYDFTGTAFNQNIDGAACDNSTNSSGTTTA